VVITIWVMDQLQPMPRVLLIPVHTAMFVSLVAAQSHLSSCPVTFCLGFWVIVPHTCPVMENDTACRCHLRESSGNSWEGSSPVTSTHLPTSGWRPHRRG
jgi:hypothetical protein